MSQLSRLPHLEEHHWQFSCGCVISHQPSMLAGIERTTLGLAIHLDRLDLGHPTRRMKPVRFSDTYFKFRPETRDTLLQYYPSS